MKKSLLRAATLVVAVWIIAPSALAICRVVEPYMESGRDAVVFDPTTMALVVLAPDQIVDYECPDVPPGYAIDDTRAHIPLPVSLPFSALASDRVAEELLRWDPSGTCWDGSPAEEVRGSLVHVVVRPAIYANGGTAGLVMPVPSRADVHVADAAVLDAAAALQVPIVEETAHYVEDPSLGHQCSDPHYSSYGAAALGAPLMLMGCGEAGSGDYYRPGLDSYETDTVESGDGTVELERIETSEDYEVTMLSASTLDALLTWLDTEGFAHDEIDDEAFGAYVGEGSWFMAVKVAPEDLGSERVALAPLVVTWRGETLPIMNRLQYDPDGATLVTDAFVLAPSEVRVAAGDGTVLYSGPANVAGSPLLSGFGLGESWLTRLEIARRMHEIKTDSYLEPVDEPEIVRPTVTRELTVRMAAACCPQDGGNVIPSTGGERTFTETRTYVQGEETPGEEIFYMAPAADEAFCPGGASHTGSSYGAGAGSGSSSGPGLFCSATEERTEGVVASLFSWAPLLLAFGLILRRRRR